MIEDRNWAGEAGRKATPREGGGDCLEREEERPVDFFRCCADGGGGGGCAAK